MRCAVVMTSQPRSAADVANRQSLKVYSCTNCGDGGLGGWGSDEWEGEWFCSRCWVGWRRSAVAKDAPLQYQLVLDTMPTRPTAFRLPFSTRELIIEFRCQLPDPVRVLECDDDPWCQTVFHRRGEEDPFGARVWPLAYVAAERLLRLGVAGKSVLELGCGCGLVSLASVRAGAWMALATDRSVPNLQLVSASATLLGACDGALAVELFDVTIDALPLPRRGLCHGGNRRIPPYASKCAEWIPEYFDYVVFSDVLYWPIESHYFGVRAAQALHAGSIVIVADCLRQWARFLEGFEAETLRLGMPPQTISPTPVGIPPCVFDWICAETGSTANTTELAPSILVLRPATEPVQWKNDSPMQALGRGRWQDYT